jgi:Ran GTPase-activating protein (RanGAP) involved in mRNA processing and transport
MGMMFEDSVGPDGGGGLGIKEGLIVIGGNGIEVEGVKCVAEALKNNKTLTQLNFSKIFIMKI